MLDCESVQGHTLVFVAMSIGFSSTCHQNFRSAGESFLDPAMQSYKIPQFMFSKFPSVHPHPQLNSSHIKAKYDQLAPSQKQSHPTCPSARINSLLDPSNSNNSIQILHPLNRKSPQLRQAKPFLSTPPKAHPIPSPSSHSMGLVLPHRHSNRAAL